LIKTRADKCYLYNQLKKTYNNSGKYFKESILKNTEDSKLHQSREDKDHSSKIYLRELTKDESFKDKNSNIMNKGNQFIKK